MGRGGIPFRIVGVLFGSCLYRVIVAIAMRFNLPASALKLVSALIVAVAIASPTLRQMVGFQKIKWRRKSQYGQQKAAANLQEHKRAVYTTLLTSGKLNGYLADIDEQAMDMMFRLVEQMADKEGVTEQLKAENPMLWVVRMNEIQARAREIINREIIYT